MDSAEDSSPHGWTVRGTAGTARCRTRRALLAGRYDRGGGTHKRRSPRTIFSSNSGARTTRLACGEVAVPPWAPTIVGNGLGSPFAAVLHRVLLAQRWADYAPANWHIPVHLPGEKPEDRVGGAMSTHGESMRRSKLV